jgi:hypothetical protein
MDAAYCIEVGFSSSNGLQPVDLKNALCPLPLEAFFARTTLHSATALQCDLKMVNASDCR